MDSDTKSELEALPGYERSDLRGMSRSELEELARRYGKALGELALLDGLAANSRLQPLPANDLQGRPGATPPP